ncbi:uncharacterized protein LOC120273617 [Dioscorea cayenensis subsp. rotundata]|uniref:Uncharacterized protein LOC120273617 n=1 Tax=Dioscorea cayennensis subsp. rotundata TaxID=55577 RepID=A0AB40C9D4_DIOCR|nr:uncharacterized protein LOC120273617 [Dioscorea cayenensis subsp. rotundata]
MAEDNILSVLSEDLSEGSEIGEDDDSGESDDVMSDDNGPDDAMTLMQYQNESRRETLIRKGSQVSGSSLKKGRLETVDRIFSLIRSHHPSIFYLVETHANGARVDRFCGKFAKKWNWAALLADGLSGGIFIIWKKHLGLVTPIAVSRRALHLVISPSFNSSWILSVIYNSNKFVSQCALWTELSKITALNFPWLIIGDLNTIASPSEHRGGSFNYYSRKAHAFSNFIDSNNLLDLNFSGCRFTWCNNQVGLFRRWARLDRGLANLAWLSNFSSVFLFHLTRTISDHAPLLLSVSFIHQRRKFLFRFYNFWLDYLGCHDAVWEAWMVSPHDNPLHSFTHLLSRTRSNILLWRASGLTSLDADMKETEESIRSLELRDSLDSVSIDRLMECYNWFSILQHHNSLRWAQRAHLLWLKDGDHNTTFFHNSVRIHTHFNTISQVCDNSGNVVSEHSDIESMFVNFYSNLWSDSSEITFTNIFNALPDDLPSLSEHEASALTRRVTKDEVFASLQDLPSGKAPGPDGFNAEFYHFS